jgi:SAM-dependent methyltransferase
MVGQKRTAAKSHRNVGAMMSVEILQTKEQYKIARTALKKRGLDCVSPFLLRVLRKLKMTDRVALGDIIKSWDVLKTVQFIEGSLRPSGAVLDIGAYGSEMLSILHRLKYMNLSGIDLSPNMHQMPHADSIHYYVGDFMNTPFKDASFDAVTAISVIEHGFDPDRLLAELFRLLKPGGYFIASVDYWPEKIDTSGIKAYGMDWTIFSAGELNSFLIKAKSYGFVPCGEINLQAFNPAVTWMGKQYTFAWLALKKTGNII